MANIQISHSAALIAALVGMTIGGFWYSPIAFGRIWEKLTGIDEHAHAVRAFIVGLLSMVVISYGLAVCVDVFNAETFLSGALVGAFIWLAFVATATLGLVIWEGKKFTLYMINAGFYLIAFAVMGGIQALFV